MWLKIPKYFTSDAQIWSTCSCQYNFSSSSIPKYCTDSTLLICITSVWIQVKFLGIGLFFKWNSTKLVFFAVDRQLICHTPMIQFCKQFFRLITGGLQIRITCDDRSIIINTWIITNHRTELESWAPSVLTGYGYIWGLCSKPITYAFPHVVLWYSQKWFC